MEENKTWRIKVEDKVETSIFYPVTKLVTLEEVVNNVPTGIIRQSVHKLNPSFKGTCSDVRKRKEMKWNLKYKKVPELVEEL